MSGRRFVRAAWTIAAKDARELWRDGRFRWLALSLSGTLVAAGLTGWIQTAATARLHLEAQRAERELALDRGEMNPHAAAHYGAFVFKPVEPLSAIDPGLDPFVGVVVFLEAHQQHGARHRPVADATPARRLGELSLADGLQTLLPLLIVALGSGAIVGERERGTLGQVLATGVSRWAFGVGKVAGCAGPIAIGLVPLGLAGVAAVSGGAGGLDGDVAFRLVLLCGVFALNALVWLLIALAVSARARSSSSALVTLLAIWFAGCVVGPRLAATAAGMLHPAPTAAEFSIAVQKGRESLPSWSERVAGVEDRFLSGELPPDPGLPSNPEVIALVDAERDESDLYDQLFADVYRAYDRQARAYQRAAWLVPAVAVRDLSMALAGTDYGFHRAFVDATRRYRAQFLDLLNRELVSYREIDTFDYTRGRELWQRMPEFTFTPPGAADTLRQHGDALSGLLIWTGVAMAGLAAALDRMAIR